MESQIERNDDPISILIISDRLIDQAKKLADYLSSMGVQIVALVSDKEKALSYLNQKFDFLVIVGYLKNRNSYEIIEESKKYKASFIAVHWAILDEIISKYCRIYKIPLLFERTLPMSEFLSFLKLHRNDKKILIIKERNELKENNLKQRNHLLVKKNSEIILDFIKKFINIKLNKGKKYDF
ncbi:hypothetical protein [Anaerovorax odorimutans]|uniref:hypothetical protein n=1 Tax=Anaerovorax odorimutans TaxID=109327 RepID=UPI00041C607C|nr:hypothetical protein [Anaerovorax odorimutans]